MHSAVHVERFGGWKLCALGAEGRERTPVASVASPRTPFNPQPRSPSLLTPQSSERKSSTPLTVTQQCLLRQHDPPPPSRSLDHPCWHPHAQAPRVCTCAVRARAPCPSRSLRKEGRGGGGGGARRRAPVLPTASRPVHVCVCARARASRGEKE